MLNSYFLSKIQEQLQTITVDSLENCNELYIFNLARVSAINYYEENCSFFKELQLSQNMNIPVGNKRDTSWKTQVNANVWSIELAYSLAACSHGSIAS